MRECLPNCGTGGCEVCKPSSTTWPLREPVKHKCESEVSPEEEKAFYELIRNTKPL